MKKKFAAKEGFTLVELIVVIAILGILAAVAVPAYSGYITKAKEASDLTALAAVKTAVDVTLTEDYLDKYDLQEIVVTGTEITIDNGTGAGAVSDRSLKADADFCGYYGCANPFTFTFNSGKTTATWTAADGGKWTLS